MKAILRHLVFVLTLVASSGYCGAVIACALPQDHTCTHHDAADKHEKPVSSTDCQSDSCSACPCHFPAYHPSTSKRTIVYRITRITTNFQPPTLVVSIEPFLQPPQA